MIGSDPPESRLVRDSMEAGQDIDSSVSSGKVREGDTVPSLRSPSDAGSARFIPEPEGVACPIPPGP
jgi:hypothetical protein